MIAIKLLHEPESDNPILSVVNLINIFLVIIAALLITVASNPMMNAFSKRDVTVITDPGKPGMEMLVKQGEKVERYKASGAIGDGDGEMAVTHKHGLMVGARTFPGNPYDGHTLAEQLEQITTLVQGIGVRPTTAIVDLGFRGVDEAIAPVKSIHRGKIKPLDKTQRRWLKRRQAIEPAIGHTKSDNRMYRCWLIGSTGDALHAVLCAAGFNIRWLLRAIAAKGWRPWSSRRWRCMRPCIVVALRMPTLASIHSARQ